MHHTRQLSIRRKEPNSNGPITRTEWHQYILQTPALSLGQPREGINPFTKQPMIFKPNKGLGFFETPSGRSSIEYIHPGELVATLAGPEAVDFVMQVAEALRAVVQPMPDAAQPGGA
jgi:hypothetical protein